MKQYFCHYIRFRYEVRAIPNELTDKFAKLFLQKIKITKPKKKIVNL